MSPEDSEERKLSDREKEVLAYIRKCRHGAIPFSPTYPEIAGQCKKENGEAVSPQFAARVVQSLLEKGLLKRDANHPSRLTLADEHAA